MRTRRTATIEDLRMAIDCLPRHTKVAMLAAIDAEPIIAGAYSNPNGICPMLAAHRHGGRTDFISFAKAWDAYAFRGTRKGRARKATERELLVLKSHLEASILEDESSSSELARAIADHRRLLAERPPLQPRRKLRERGHPDGADRTAELRHRPGWAWLRVMRRYDDYRQAIEQLDREPGRLVRDELERVR